jgi:putative transposase
MPRHARCIFPGVPHHVTQRGNHRRDVFYERRDALAYLSLLRQHTERHGIDIAAYCLMPNHVHLVVVPSTVDGLHRALKVVHGRYAQRINRMRRRTGHLWQDRYFSSPLDSNHFLNAVRYVELNPVRAGLVDRGESYEWSSAAAHCDLRSDSLVAIRPHSMLFRGIEDWSTWLANGLARENIEMLRRHTSQNLPCGSEEFVKELELVAGRPLRYRPRGRPPARAENDDASAPFVKRLASPLGKGDGHQQEKVSVPI